VSLRSHVSILKLSERISVTSGVRGEHRKLSNKFSHVVFIYGGKITHSV
jgi:3-keto-L-gulonate-6-phosphate decarboxylase